MDNGHRRRRTSLLRLVDSKSGGLNFAPDDLSTRPVGWPERLGWAVFGLIVVAIWIRVGMWLWGLIAS
jgi:hypothetical protein